MQIVVIGTYRVTVGDNGTVPNVQVDITIEDLNTSNVLTSIYMGNTGPGIRVRVLTNLVCAIGWDPASSELLDEGSGNIIRVLVSAKVVDDH